VPPAAAAVVVVAAAVVAVAGQNERVRRGEIMRQWDVQIDWAFAALGWMAE
jgi:hypothetical protein